MDANYSRTKNKLLAKVFGLLPGLTARWAKNLSADESGIPWSKPAKPLREATVALVSTGGVHLGAQPPFDMNNKDGDPSFREIPTNTPNENLTITHDYYNHADAEKDLNLVYPVQRLKELEARGVLKAVHDRAYALMGHIDGELVSTLEKRTGPEIAKRLKSAGVDYALLVPA